jgi:hypothetical protein
MSRRLTFQRMKLLLGVRGGYQASLLNSVSIRSFCYAMEMEYLLLATGAHLDLLTSESHHRQIAGGYPVGRADDR